MGPHEIGQLAPTPNWAGLLDAMGVIVTSHSGHYGITVAGFIYIFKHFELR